MKIIIVRVLGYIAIVCHRTYRGTKYICITVCKCKYNAAGITECACWIIAALAVASLVLK